MCLKMIKIDRVNAYGVSSALVPCGHCVDCRKKAQNAWKFRLLNEFLELIKCKWNVGFVTLTYNEASLPYIPEECFKDPESYRPIPSFNRAHVREWIDKIRHYCKYHYRFIGDDKIRYFIVSEFGSMKHRPHYHALLAFPARCSYEKMHELCKMFWQYGYIGPRYVDGDHNCRPFYLDGDPSKLMSYVAKYVAKDLDFYSQIDYIDMYDEPLTHYGENTNEYFAAKAYKNCLPFHIQSCSVGWRAFNKLDEGEKIDVLENGFHFVGDDFSYSLPRYIVNKLIFINKYEFIDGERKVRRYASDFLVNNAERIFKTYAENKYKCVSNITPDFLLSSGVDRDIVGCIGDSLQSLRNLVYSESSDLIECSDELYLAYYNIDYDKCYDVGRDYYKQWLQRYLEHPVNYPLIDGSFAYKLSFLRNYWHYATLCNTLVGYTKREDREKKEKLIKELNEFYNYIVK